MKNIRRMTADITFPMSQNTNAGYHMWQSYELSRRCDSTLV